jgi:hypothetical protein
MVALIASNAASAILMPIMRTILISTEATTVGQRLSFRPRLPSLDGPVGWSASAAHGGGPG